MEAPVRILQIVTNMSYGGLENFIMNNYRNIDRTRVQFDFLTHFEGHQDYEEEIEQLGGKIYRIKKFNPLNKAYINELNGFFASHNEYKVIHCHMNCLSGTILKAAKDNGVPVRIAHAHTVIPKKMNKEYILKSMLKKSIPMYATDMFACGENAGKFVFGNSNYKIISNSINTEQYIYSSERSEKQKSLLGLDGCFVVGHVGMFREEKNHAYLLELIKYMTGQDDNVRLLSVGNGPLFEDIKKEAVAMGIADKIVFTGGRSDVADLMQAMDVFVLPSLFEGFPLTLVEAQAAGLPCITSDNVPEECKLTDKYVRLSLDDPMEKWIKTIYSFKNTERKNNRSVIENAGFDIVTNAKKLEDFYVGKYNGQ